VDKKQVGKSARLIITRETYQILQELAGSDMSPGSYLDKIIGDLARGKHEKSIGEKLPADIPFSNELAFKLDNIASGIERLTNLLLENQKYAGSTRMTPSPGVTNTTRQGQAEEYESAHSNSKSFGPPKQERSHSNPPAYSSNIGHSFPPLQVGGDRRGEEDIEEKIRKYEAENPW
jgi:hypothetical protein